MINLIGRAPVLSESNLEGAFELARGSVSSRREHLYRPESPVINAGCEDSPGHTEEPSLDPRATSVGIVRSARAGGPLAVQDFSQLYRIFSVEKQAGTKWFLCCRAGFRPAERRRLGAESMRERRADCGALQQNR